ncbi:conserved hypothetical protein [groundwater metagenome]|uniref:AAA+ ATPase domain-containing protein n=1 Tax=groundwater metagenome TaxID=717931 RepID=A0A098EDK4_9ZZZZ
MNTTKKFEHYIEFFNREEEKEKILNILRQEPQEINFIYGPINSGKTTLIQKLIEDLPKDKYTVFYINLRGKLIKEYGGFVRALFKVKRKEISEKLSEKGEKLAKKALVFAGRYLSGIPIEKDMFDGFLDAESTEDVFEFLEEYFLKISETKIPILIIDELQVIGDLEINGKAIYKLFNFFIRLTKELHICHVFTLSSDSLFIERVYNEAMLHGRCNYLIIDDFDEQTTKKFLEKYDLTEEERELVWHYFGGKPHYLLYTVLSKWSNKNIKDTVNEKIKEKVKYLEDVFDELLYTSPKVKIGDKENIVNREKLMELLKKFTEHEKIEDKGISRAEKIYFINKNILFLDIKKELLSRNQNLTYLQSGKF